MLYNISVFSVVSALTTLVSSKCMSQLYIYLKQTCMYIVIHADLVLTFSCFVTRFYNKNIGFHLQKVYVVS